MCSPDDVLKIGGLSSRKSGLGHRPAGISSGSDTWPVLAQGLPWQIMIGAGRCSSSAFAVVVGGNTGTQPLELWRSGRRAFWEESRGQSAEFFHDQSPSLPRRSDCVTADGSRCLIPRGIHRFRPNRDANPLDPPRDESPRPPTSRCVSWPD